MSDAESTQFARVRQACDDVQFCVEVMAAFAQELSVPFGAGPPASAPGVLEDVRGMLLKNGHPPEIESLVREFRALLRNQKADKLRATRVTLAACKCAYRYADRASVSPSIEVAWQEIANARVWEGIARGMLIVNNDKQLASALMTLETPKVRYRDRREFVAEMMKLLAEGRSKSNACQILAKRNGSKRKASTLKQAAKSIDVESPANGK